MTTGTADEIRIGGMAIRFLLEGGQTEGSLAMFEFGVPAGAKVPAAHSHDGYEETIYGLDGVLTWTIDGTQCDVGAGDVAFVPRGTVHQFHNGGDVDARALAIVTPGVLGPEYFREIAAIVDATTGPPDLAAIGVVMRRHGLTPAP